MHINSGCQYVIFLSLSGYPLKKVLVEGVVVTRTYIITTITVMLYLNGLYTISYSFTFTTY
jgi:hypothetical protein